jgi:hypothetical protein
MHRHELDRGHAQIAEMVEHGIRRKPEKGAALALRNLTVSHGHAFDVALVDDGSTPRNTRGPVVGPIERRVHDHTFRQHARAVARVHRRALTVGHGVGEQLLAPSHRTADRARVGIEQQLGRIEPVSLGRSKGAVDAEAVTLTGPDLRHIGMPHVLALLGERHTLALGIVGGIPKQTQLHGSGVLGERGKVGPFPVPRGAEW